MISAEDRGDTRPVQRIHEGGSLTEIPSTAEGLARICECGFRVAEEPQNCGALEQRRYPDVLAKTRYQRPRLRRIVKRDCTIKMRSPFRGVARKRQGNAHKAMPGHERNGRLLFLSEGQILRSKLTHHIAVERDVVSGVKAGQDQLGG